MTMKTREARSLGKSDKKTRIKCGVLVRQVRKALGYSQIEFSKEMGISQANLSKLENGIVMPSALLWLKICDIGSIPYDSIR